MEKTKVKRYNAKILLTISLHSIMSMNEPIVYFIQDKSSTSREKRKGSRLVAKNQSSSALKFSEAANITQISSGALPAIHLKSMG